MSILNLTQNVATPEQIAQGVIEVPEEHRKALLELLTFTSLPTEAEITKKAVELAELALACSAYHDFQEVMIGGAPYLMPRLQAALEFRYYEPVYAYYQQVSVESVSIDGTVVKTTESKHLGFVSSMR
jgi:hypothetical protein